jgi:hypothetical protein
MDTSDQHTFPWIPIRYMRGRSVYDYITKLCMQQAEVIQNRENANVLNIGQGEF